MPLETDKLTDLPLRRRGYLPLGTALGLGFVIVATIVIAIFSVRGLRNDAAAADRVTHTMAVLESVESLLSRVKDAETSQRGYLLTGKDAYLSPLNTARADLPKAVADVRRLVAESPDQRDRIECVSGLIERKLTELMQTVELQQAGKTDEALAIVLTDRGKDVMDEIRSQLGAMSSAERTTLAERQADWKESTTATTELMMVGRVAILVLLLVGGVLMSRDYRRQTAETWSDAGLSVLGTRLQGDMRLDVLGRNALDFLAAALDAQVGAIYIIDADGVYRRIAAFAMAGGLSEFRPRESLLGQAVANRRPLRVSDVPSDYIDVNSGVGKVKPTEIVIVPIAAHGSLQAAIELGFMRALDPDEFEFLSRACEIIGMSVRSAKDRSRLEDLLEETQRQSEELQTQQEELRVSNEELEEQSRALRESRTQLELQQTELEQTNSQLEEQTQLLEHQKDELSQAAEVLMGKAHELELANKYKSEFLANMSHELRTPLNSTLILARLLSDNKTGNLTDEQVKYAQTISSAGNELLGLINDILDLSKIEAGKVELQPQSVPVRKFTQDLCAGFAPLAEQKNLKLIVSIEQNAPERIETDPQRVSQVLKNLLSNALKFTERGEIEMRAFSRDPGTISFAVRDTGIGIERDQHAIIFEAFRQADGSTHRKYGGTGLGLSISRDLARLLGGSIELTSAAGRGSTFTFTLPVAFVPNERAPQPKSSSTLAALAARREILSDTRRFTETMAEIPAAQVADDRGSLTAQSRRILIVEDDIKFAAILRDLVHEQGFQCVIVHDGAAGLAAANRYEPHGILLDMQLPTLSGLDILQELKRNPRTRHIPVHIVSVADMSEEALRLGAVGFAFKPVERDELVVALRKLESKFTPGNRRVLLIEDDDRQRASVKELLAALDVEIRDVSNANQALELLKSLTFDCTVMDLNLPDMSGFDLLQRMSEQDDIAFPPVIIYTGRSLTADEETRLRRFSRSIIVKDARSPDRLLDEVTLFLHQVESKLPVETQRMLTATRSRDATLEGRRVLLVEDDVRNIFALTKVLEQAGVKLQIARNGLEALASLEKYMGSADTKFDLVLMDIMMPEMDGLTAMREIRKRAAWKKLPIIAVTAKAMRDDQERAIEAGANDYIAKPVDIEKLLSLARVWISKS
jgi:signal transduction histidine kinase/DNA-binding response OmpR family regulator/CHASE3 domain sensor protein